MSNKLAVQLLKVEILEFIKKTNGSVTLQEILSHLTTPESKRKIQRILTVLVEKKMIYRIGQGPSTRYQILGVNRLSAPTLNDQTEQSYINWLPLSETSKKIIAIVSQPMEARTPTSYHRDFLDRYIPNETWYLDQNLRSFLHQIGKTSDQVRAAGTYGRDILNRLLIDLSWASSKLEGNTYSILDTKRLIEYGQSIEGKNIIDTQMILNHKDAIKFLVENIEDITVNRHTILNLHGLLSYALLANPDDAGRIRTKIIDISGTTFKPLFISQVLDECFNIILNKAMQINDAFEQAFFLMVQLPYLQPFMDVNKRVSRLSANIPLLKNNLCPLTFIGMPEQAYIHGTLGVYELNDTALLKDVFVFAYERSVQEYLAVHQSLVAPDPLRIKYRKNIQELVHLIVKKYHKNMQDSITNIIEVYSQDHITQSDQLLFKQFIHEDLRQLHDGVLARYRLNQSDFKKWQYP